MSKDLERHHCTGQLGSDFRRISVPPEIVLALAERIDGKLIGRRVMKEPSGGIV